MSLSVIARIRQPASRLTWQLLHASRRPTFRHAMLQQPSRLPMLAQNFMTSAPRFDRISDAQEQIKQGTEYLNKGSIQMAMSCYHKSVQIAPSAAGYFNIGVCYFQMGKHKDAVEAFERSLQFEPNQADAHTNIASAYLMLKNVPLALKHLEQASNFNPLDGEVQYNLGCVYEAKGDLEAAKTRFERAQTLGIGRADEALEKLAKKMNK